METADGTPLAELGPGAGGSSGVSGGSAAAGTVTAELGPGAGGSSGGLQDRIRAVRKDNAFAGTAGRVLGRDRELLDRLGAT